MATNYKFVGGHRCGALTVAGTSTCPLSHQAPYPWHGAIHHKDHMETCIFCKIGNYAWLLSDSLHRRVGGRTEVRNTCPFIKALISLSGIGGDVWEDMVAMETELNLGIIGCARGSLPHPRQLTFQSTIAPLPPFSISSSYAATPDGKNVLSTIGGNKDHRMLDIFLRMTRMP